MNNVSNLIIQIVIGALGLALIFFPEIVALNFKTRLSILVGAILLIVLIAVYTRLSRYLRKLAPQLVRFVSLFFHPLAKMIYLFVLFGLIIYFSNLAPSVIVLSSLFLIVALTSIKWFPVKNVALNEYFEDGLASWNVVTGNPNINDYFGNPSPCLSLHVVQGIKTNCFLELLPIRTPKHGIIECDVFLDPGSLLNIVFRADPSNERWYMARFETRGRWKDAFLKNSGNGWGFLKPADGNTEPGKWYRMKIELDGPKAKLFKNKILIAEMDDDEFEDGSIGIFNEVGRVHVDNFSVTNLKTH